jgi:hypothetical protein
MPAACHARRSAFALAALAALAAPATAHAQDDRGAIRERLLTQGPQRIVVVLDGTLERVQAAGRSAVASRACDCEVSTFPRYDRLKQRALCGLPDLVVTLDSDVAPQVTAVVSSVAGLEALLARPDVRLVYSDSLVVGPPGPVLLDSLSAARIAALGVPYHGEGPHFSCAFAPGRSEATWLSGDWNGDGIADVGKYDPALDAFLLDLNGNGLWDGALGGDRLVRFAPGRGPGAPLVGDWNGDGREGVGKHVAPGRVYLDADEDGAWEGRAGGDVQSWVDGELVVGDWDGDGDDALGQYLRPALRFTPGSFPPEPDRFLLDDGDGVWEGPPADPRVPIAANPLCPGRPIAFDWDAGHAGDGVGKIWGRWPDPDFGYALDLDEDEAWRGNGGGDLLVVGRVVEFCGPLAELF